jgi:heme/copper-type cytochrome/quinol oxidase subunit 2
MSALWRAVLVLVALVPATITTWAQMPQDLPNDPEPVEMDSLLKIVVFIVIPVLLIVSLFIWKRKNRNNKEDDGKVQE